MILAGPCLLNDRQEEITDLHKTAQALKAIDKDIILRCKLWGGGTTPAKVKWGIGDKGIWHLNISMVGKNSGEHMNLLLAHLVTEIYSSQ